MTVQQIITWLLYNWEFVVVGVTLLAVAYGARTDVREAQEDEVQEYSVSRQTRVNVRLRRQSPRGINR